MFGLIVMLSMTLSGHPSIVNKINRSRFWTSHIPLLVKEVCERPLIPCIKKQFYVLDGEEEDLTVSYKNLKLRFSRQLIKVSKFQKQIFLLLSEPKTNEIIF